MDEKHLKTKKKMKISGICLIIFGGVCVIVGLINFFSSILGGKMPALFFLLFIGMPILAGGIMLTTMGYRGELTRYFTNENAPIINEFTDKVSPAIRNATSAIHEGMSAANNTICDCGEANPEGAVYCSACGAVLIKICPNCETHNPKDAQFCNKCGSRLY